MPTHYAVLLVSDSQDNPEGLPPQLIRDSRWSGPSLEKGLSDLRYKLMTEAEFEVLQKTLEPVYFSWKQSKEATKEAEAQQEASTLESKFDELQAIKDKVDGAGGSLDPADQISLLSHTLEILLSMRESLLQIRKRT